MLSNITLAYGTPYEDHSLYQSLARALQQLNVHLTHLGWPGGIDLRSGSVLLLKVSGSILLGVNFGGLL